MEGHWPSFKCSSGFRELVLANGRDRKHDLSVLLTFLGADCIDLYRRSVVVCYVSVLLP